MPIDQRTMKILSVSFARTPDTKIAQYFKKRFEFISQETSPRINYQLFTADSTNTALESFQNNHPDLVLINLAENGQAAKNLCQKIRAKEVHRHTGIIFYLTESSSNSELMPVECLELGADDFIAAQTSPREFLARVNAVLRLKAMTDELRSANHRLEILSLTDDLTGLHNMRSFNIEYASMLENCRLGNYGLGVVIWDLDKFKQVNDKCNHLVGSFVISEVGKLVKFSRVLGNQACLARYGGDEYVSCIPANSVTDVMKKANNLKKIIQRSQFKKDEYTIELTASVGVSWIAPFFTGKADDPLKAADVMLYRSKNLGRNRICGMVLTYPVNFDHVSRAHLVDWDTSSDDNDVSSLDNF